MDQKTYYDENASYPEINHFAEKLVYISLWGSETEGYGEWNEAKPEKKGEGRQIYTSA